MELEKKWDRDDGEAGSPEVQYFIVPFKLPRDNRDAHYRPEVTLLETSSR